MPNLSPYQQAVARVANDFYSKARPSQIADFTADWSLMGWMAGRAYGKTWCLNHNLFLYFACRPNIEGAIVAPTIADTKKVTLNNKKSGLRSIIPPECLLGGSWDSGYNKSEGIIKLANNSTIYLDSAEKPDRLRGGNYSLTAFEEFAAFKDINEIYDMAKMATRVGDRPRMMFATTPRPLRVLKDILKDNKSIIVRGSTFENKDNLPDVWLGELKSKYDGTRQGRQELYGEILEDFEGALWNYSMIEATRPKSEIKPMSRIVVAIDPSGTKGNDGGDKVGIVVAGIGQDDLYYVIDDLTVSCSPNEWAKIAINAFYYYSADLIVAEVNFGGPLVEELLRKVDTKISYKAVRASKGKAVRAEPISALYEQGKVIHVKELVELEAQMCEMTAMGYKGKGSPDRVDALVWALTELSVLQVRVTGASEF
jgi:phage terminase large subunit-like protein